MQPYFSIQWHITDTCDQRCKHCYIFSEGHPRLVTTPLAQLKSTYAQIVRFCEKLGSYHSARRRYLRLPPHGEQGGQREYGRSVCRLDGRGRILYLELGVGMNTPGIIKYPFWCRTARNPKARYVCINLEMAYAPAEIADRSLCISSDLSILEELTR